MSRFKFILLIYIVTVLKLSSALYIFKPNTVTMEAKCIMKNPDQNAQSVTRISL